MHLRILPLVVVLLVSAAVPRPASADMLDFFRWWDSLSGPGPWIGWGYQQPIVTWGVERDQDGKRLTTAQSTFFDPSGILTHPATLYARVGAEVAVMWTSDSDLQYAPGVDPPKVYAFPVLATADVGKNGLEGGLGLGFLRLSAPDSGRWHFIFEPRVTVKPFVLAHRNRPDGDRKLWHEMLQARFYLTRVGEIRPVDFGAIGPADAGGEWVPGFAFTVSPLAIREYLRNR